MKSPLRTQLLAGISVVGLSLAATGSAMAADPAPDPFAGWMPAMSGYVEGYGGYSWVDGGAVNANEEDEFGFLGGSARLNIPGTPFFDFQFDVDGERALGIGDASDSYGGGIQTGAHALFRATERFSVGVFGALGVVDPEDDTSSTGRAAEIYFAGVEGLWETDQFQILVQGGYADSHHSPEFEVMSDAFFGRAQGRFFFSDYTMIQGDFAYWDGHNDFDSPPADNVEVVQWGARLEHQFAGFQPFDLSTLSVFGEYRGLYFDDDGAANNDATDHSILFGVKLALGQPTLRSTYLHGPSATLPNAVRAITMPIYGD